MNAVREAFVLPIIFLTVTLLGGLRIGAEIRFLPPALTAVVLGVLTIASVIRAGAWDPTEVVNHARSPVENLSGIVVALTLAAASIQVFNLLTPDRGLLHVIFGTFFFVQLLSTIAGTSDRRALLRSLLRIPRLGVRASLHRAGIGVRPKRRHVDARAHDADGGRLARGSAVRSEWGGDGLPGVSCALSVSDRRVPSARRQGITYESGRPPGSSRAPRTAR